jgi:hypothetical protein
MTRKIGCRLRAADRYLPIAAPFFGLLIEKLAIVAMIVNSVRNDNFWSRKALKARGNPPAGRRRRGGCAATSYQSGGKF